MPVTKKYLKRKFPGNHAMQELIDYFASAARVEYFVTIVNIVNNFFTTESKAFDVYIDFQDTTAFTYNCPAALKFTQVINESTAPTLSVTLNTNMAQFDKLTITPAAAGLVILKGELL